MSPRVWLWTGCDRHPRYLQMRFSYDQRPFSAKKKKKVTSWKILHSLPRESFVVFWWELLKHAICTQHHKQTDYLYSQLTIHLYEKQVLSNVHVLCFKGTSQKSMKVDVT